MWSFAWCLKCDSICCHIPPTDYVDMQHVFIDGLLMLLEALEQCSSVR